MRLLKIGSSPDCDIVLNSRRVSALHAELIMLNNGDILLEDKGSTNGTFVNNQPIKQGASVPVRRGDLIRFADTELQWASVPQPTNNSMFKKIYGIGSNMRYNDIQVTGNTVSHFHATLKIDKNGRAFIEDHSLNGTSINGKRIAAHQNVRVKRGDDVVVGGVPVDLKPYIKPDIWSTVLKVGGSSAAIAAVVMLAMMIIGPDNHSICGGYIDPYEYVSSVAYVHAYYHYTAKIVGDPFVSICQKYNIPYSSEYKIGVDSKGRMGIISDTSSYSPIGYGATAFFVSQDGKMITNRHVAAPWKFASEAEKAEINRIVTKLKESSMSANQLKTKEDLSALFVDAIFGSMISSVTYQLFDKDLMSVADLDATIKIYKNCPISINGELDYIAVGYPNRRYTSIDEFERCTAIGEARDENVDIALLQLNSGTTPPTVVRTFDLNKSILNPKGIVPLKDRYYYIGYPAGVAFNVREDGLRPQAKEVLVSRDPERYTIDLQGEVIGGASGSPVFDKRGRLIGVISSHYTIGSTMGRCELIKYAKELYDEFEFLN